MGLENCGRVYFVEKIVIANLKMNMTTAEIGNYLKGIEQIDTKRVIICPSALYLPYFLKKKYKVGVQNIHFEEEGSYTGEISPKQVASMGIHYTLIGHSERRQNFGETDLIINKKIQAAIDNKLAIILCIGETKEDRDLMKTDRVLKRQIVNALRNVKPSEIKNIIIAYEPVWAIGTSLTPKNQEIKTAAIFIKNIVKTLYNDFDVPILYGGSVSAKNIETINKIDNLNGVLVGKSSLKPSELLKIKEIVIG